MSQQLLGATAVTPATAIPQSSASSSSIYNTVMSAAALGLVGWMGFTMYSCYKKTGSIGLSCLIQDVSSGLVNSAIDGTKDVYSKLLAPAAKGIYKEALKPAGKAIYGKVLKPVGKGTWKGIKSAGALEKNIIKTEIKMVTHPKEIVRALKPSNVKKAFSKKHLKKSMHNLFKW